MMENSRKPTEKDVHIDVKHFSIQEWVELKQLIIEHIIIHLNLADTYIKDIVWVFHNRNTDKILGEYRSTFMTTEQVQTMILWEVGDLTLWLTRYYMLGRHKEYLWTIAKVALMFKRKYRHKAALCIVKRVKLVFRIIYM